MRLLAHRLFAFGHALARPPLPWPPTEPERIAASEALGGLLRFVPFRLPAGPASLLARSASSVLQPTHVGSPEILWRLGT